MYECIWCVRFWFLRMRFLSEDLFTITNSVDPDEMLHNHLGLHCS